MPVMTCSFGVLMKENGTVKKELTIIGIIWQNLQQVFQREKQQRTYLSYPEPPDDIVRVRSLFIRHLDCGSCNGCEMELNSLNNPVYDIGKYGIHFEASPRHADIVVMTGPYARNLNEAVQSTIDAMAEPCIITIGDCAKDGGVFQDSYAIQKRPDEIEAYIIGHVPGCPPEPQDILNMLLTAECK